MAFPPAQICRNCRNHQADHILAVCASTLGRECFGRFSAISQSLFSHSTFRRRDLYRCIRRASPQSFTGLATFFRFFPSLSVLSFLGAILDV
jgi:hypothetical protein